MRKIIIITVALIASLPALTFAEEQPTVQPAKTEKTIRIGYVDMPSIARESAPGRAAYAEIKAQTEKYQKQIQAREKQLQKQKAAIEAQLPTLPPQQREAKAKEFQKKVESFQKFVQNADKEVRAKEEELLAKIFKAVEAAAGNYARANGYAAVVMKNQTLYIGEEVESKDLTSEIIKSIEGTIQK